MRRLSTTTIGMMAWSKRVCVLLVVSLLFDLSVCLCRPECLDAGQRGRRLGMAATCYSRIVLYRASWCHIAAALRRSHLTPRENMSGYAGVAVPRSPRMNRAMHGHVKP